MIVFLLFFACFMFAHYDAYFRIVETRLLLGGDVVALVR